MELRITSLFNPLSRIGGFFFSELGVTPTAVAFSAFISAILAFIFFVSPFALPFVNIQFILTLAVILMFVNAVLSDVERRLEKRVKKKSIFGGPLGTILGQLSDVFIIFGALIFLSLKDTYYNFGRFFFIDFSYVEPGFAGHLGLGAVCFLGILLLRKVAAQKKEKGTGLWTRSERMYMLGFFGAAGIFSGRFSGLLFSGILLLTLALYISIVRRVFSTRPARRSGRPRSRMLRHFRRGLTSGLTLFPKAFKGILRIVGVVLLGLYLAVEKFIVWLKGLKSALKDISPFQGSRDRASTRHPPIKPFSGTIAPSASSLPAGPEEIEGEGPQTITGEPRYPGEIAQEDIISLPPPEHLMGEDVSYAREEVGESMLVLHVPASNKEKVLYDMVDFMIGEGKDVIVVSSQPGTANYRERLKGIPGVRVIDLSLRSSIPTGDAIPVTNLEYFSEVFEELDGRHVIVFEPLTHLILQIGVSQAYRFISGSLNQLSRLGATLIVFINKEGHDTQDLSNFENLFTNIADIEDGRLKKVK